MHKKILFMVLLTLLASTLALAGARILFIFPPPNHTTLGQCQILGVRQSLNRSPPVTKPGS